MDRREEEIANSADKEGENKVQGAAESTDKELEELLDNALSDFLANSSPAKTNESDTSVAESAGAAGAAGGAHEEEAKPEEINLEAVFAVLKKLTLTDKPEGGPMSDMNPILAEFTKMTEAVQSPEEGAEIKEFMATVMDSIKGLSETAEKLQSEGSAAGLVDMLEASDMTPDELAKSIEMEMNPYIMQIMEMFLSKDILYPPMKDLVLQFPEWLAANEASLSEAEYSNHVKQLDVMKRVCAEYEKEEPTDSAEVKSQRYKTLLELMQELKEYGHPPAELLGEMPFKIDENGLPYCGIGTDAEQCCLM